MTDSLAIAFAGTPDLAATILARLIEDGRHRIEQVFTRPDRQAGRGRQWQASPVKRLAQEAGLAVSHPASTAELAGETVLDRVDLLVVAAFGLILPETVIYRPRHGSVNVHTSLLPRWRGAAPIQRAIEAGDTETGITIMQMDTGMDTGAILLQQSCAIHADDTAASLHDRLAPLGAECLLRTLEAITQDRLRPLAQDEAQATYAPKITKAEAEIDWSRPAPVIARKVRAFNPAPVAYTTLRQQPMRIWEARALDGSGREPPGTVLAHAPEGLDVATGSGVLRILSLQLPGKKVISCREFYHGRPDFNR